MEGLLFNLSHQRKAWHIYITLKHSKETSHRDRLGKSNPESGSRKCEDAAQVASVAGAILGEEIRVGWQVMVNFLTSKPGHLKGMCSEDSKQQLWHAS